MPSFNLQPQLYFFLVGWVGFALQDHTANTNPTLRSLNWDVPPDFELPYPPKLDADECMDEGRSIRRYNANGATWVRPLGKSWKGDASNPEADTGLPILVDDTTMDQPTHLKPHEAEQLMGMPKNCTSGAGLSIARLPTAKQRLKSIGAGWDITVVGMFFDHFTPTMASLVHKVGSTLPEGALSEDDEEVKVALALYREAHGRDAVAELLSDFGEDEALRMVGLLADFDRQVQSHKACVVQPGSILDSGSSRHIHPRVKILDADEKISLTGFDDSRQWTNGSGFLPLEMQDESSGTNIKVDIDHVDQLESVASPILSLGKLLRLGYEFHLSEHGKDCFMLTPGGASKVLIELGEDDIVRLPHTTREGKDAERLPASHSCNVVSRNIKGAQSKLLHDMLNHSSMVKVYETLGVTTNYKQV